MKQNAIDTLFYPILTGAFTLPTGRRAVFLNAQLPADFTTVRHDWFRSLTAIQPDRALWLNLQDAGIAGHCEMASGDMFDVAFIAASNHRRLTEDMIAQAARHLLPKGAIFITGAKTDGIAALKKKLISLGCEVESQAKYHAQVLRFSANQVLASLAAQPIVLDGGFHTAPGMFSADHVDPASALLVEHLPDLTGRKVADFGSGWGFLAGHILSCSMPQKLDLYEAHWPSLEASKRSLTSRKPEVAVDYYWHDLAREPVARQYDAIVMNPPFHKGNQTRKSLGEAFVRRASDALLPGGKLYMVANTGLMYEPLLAQTFGQVQEICRQDGFKIIAARR